MIETGQGGEPEEDRKMILKRRETACGVGEHNIVRSRGRSGTHPSLVV